jgi:hypothetical protein
VLYRLAQVLEAVKTGEKVFLVEGEKDVHALERFSGLVATCCPRGAGKWRPEYSEALRGADVAVVADRDDAGRQHAAEVARALQGVAADVAVLEPTKGKDMAEHLANGGGTDELVTVEPPGAISTERTERFPQIPLVERDYTVRWGTERLANEDRTEPPKLAFEDHVLDHHDKLMDAYGLVGERHVSRCTYLVHISRLLAQPSRMVVKGDSSTGMSFATECSLKAAAPEALYVRTQTSPLALFYSEEDFRHKTLVFYEANKLGDDDDPLARVLRTLISEGKLAYEVTVPEKRSSQLLEKDGPVAFISTTCKVSLDKEIETRILSLHSDNSDDQTKAVVASILEAAAVGTPTEPELSEWHALDRCLAGGPCDVVVPWAPALASFELTGPPRLRRDISNLLALARAHALLHRETREVDDRERVISTLDDYDVVRNLLSDALAVATDKAVRDGTRKLVEAVAALRAEEGAKPISMSAASRKAGRSKSTANTDVHDALEKGYLVNRSPSPDRFNLDIGDPLPEQADLLPKTGDLSQAFARRSAVVRYPTERCNPAPRAGFGETVRSVRSISPRADIPLSELPPSERTTDASGARPPGPDGRVADCLRVIKSGGDPTSLYTDNEIRLARLCVRGATADDRPARLPTRRPPAHARRPRPTIEGVDKARPARGAPACRRRARGGARRGGGAMTATNIEPWLDKKGLAEHLGCCERWIEYRMREGMPAWKIAGRIKFRVSEVEAWLIENAYMERA